MDFNLNIEYQFVLFGLLLLPLLGLVYFLLRKQKRNRLQKLGDKELVDQMLANYNTSAFPKRYFLLVGVIGLLILAIANFRTPLSGQSSARSGTEVMIVLDLSKSMLAQDVKPDRLQRAKQMLDRLIEKLPNDKVGIIIFAGRAYLQMPLSTDHTAAKMYINAASTQSIPTQGTVIGDALKMAAASFNAKERKYKSIVLVSDGEDHDEEAVSTAKDLRSEGIIVHTVGIGSLEGGPIVDPATGSVKQDENGNVVISRLNGEEMQKIADNGDGLYQLYNNSESVVANLVNQISNMDKKNISDDSLTNYQSFFQIFAGLALLLLILDLFIKEIKKRKMRPVYISTMLVVCFFSSTVYAQDPKELIKSGNTAYKNGAYTEAVAEYNKALQAEPGNVTATYNLGNAQYKAGKKDDAIVIYDKLIAAEKDPQKLSNAYYNKGVVLHNDNKLPECIEAYKAALRLTPNDDDARQNLQKALKKQQEDKKDNKDNKDQDNKDKNNPKDDGNQDKPKPNPSNLSQKEAEDKLKALMQEEKNLQNKLNKSNPQSPAGPDKDW